MTPPTLKHRTAAIDTSTVSREKTYSDWKVLALQIGFHNCFQASNGLQMADGSIEKLSTHSDFHSEKTHDLETDSLYGNCFHLRSVQALAAVTSEGRF